MTDYKNRRPRFISGGAAEKTKTVRSIMSIKLLSISLVLALIGASGASLAQTSSSPGLVIDSTDTVTRAPRNTFAENWKPKVRRVAALHNRVYNPIKKQDDQAQIPEIEMFVGESRVFPTPGVARIAVGNGSIMTATALDNKEVLLFANAVGTSSLFVWNEDGRYQNVKINIVPGDTSRFAREIAAFLITIPHAKASIIGDKVIVEGDNLSDVDIAKIDELAKRYPQIVNFTNRLGWEQMVFMDVKVVEFPTSELRDIGLKWSALGGAVVGGIWQPLRRGTNGPYQINIQTGTTNPPPITAPGGGAALLPSGLNVVSALNLGLNAQLNLLAQNGKAAILAEPQLSARNGSKATFLSGGEYPYTVSTVNGPTVFFKPYGVKLNITPRVDRNGVIRATIESEVSTIDPSISTPSGPGLLSRKTTTEFNVRNGQTIVLSGLLSRENSTNIDKVPFLGDIPILGSLFRSTHFVNKETELVVFVTPTVIDSHSPGLVDRIERTTERLQQDLGKSPYLSNPLQPEHDPAKVNQAPSKPRPAMENTAAPGATTNTQTKIAKQPAEPPARVAVIAQPALLQSIDSVPLVPATQNPLQTTSETSIATKTAGTGGSTRTGIKPAAAEASATIKNSSGAAGKHYRVLHRLALRVTPDLNARVIRHLARGTVIEALPQATRGYWMPVQVDGKRGWVGMRWLVPEQ